MAPRSLRVLSVLVLRVTVVDMSFKTPPKFNSKFKTVSASWGMSMKELIEASFNLWVEKHGVVPPDADD